LTMLTSVGVFKRINCEYVCQIRRGRQIAFSVTDLYKTLFSPKVYLS